MTPRQLRRILRRKGCIEIRQTGSHLIVRCDRCQTTVPLHGRDIPTGTLAEIVRQLAPCLGEKWFER